LVWRRWISSDFPSLQIFQGPQMDSRLNGKTTDWLELADLL
jgi:hypothetical protein